MTIAALRLSKEQAVAQRLLYKSFAPVEFWQWLAGKSVESHSISAWSNPALEKHLAAIFATTGATGTKADSAKLLRQQSCIASALQYIHSRSNAEARGLISQLNAASLLPAYRTLPGGGLAAGNMEQWLRETRRAVADSLVVVGLQDELGSDLLEVLSEGAERGLSPAECCKKSFGLDLEVLAQLLVTAGYQWSGDSEAELNKLITASVRGSDRPSWSAAPVLWRLAGEVLGDRAEFILPRDWISVAVPWQEVARQLRSMQRHLDAFLNKSESPKNPTLNSPATLQGAEDRYSSAVYVRSQKSNESAEASPDTGSNVPSGDTLSNAHWLRGDSANLEAEAASLGGTAAEVRTEADVGKTIDRAIEAIQVDLAQPRGFAVGASTGRFDLPASQAASPATDREVYGTPLAQEAVECDRPGHNLADYDSAPSEAHHPRVLIAEVRSHNDPVFLSVVRRQLAASRLQSCTLSLCAIRLQPESGSEDGEIFNKHSSGMVIWQQLLVNQLVDHPEVHQPYAFVSGNGELILCLMDIERTSATQLLRETIAEILSGQPLSSSAGYYAARQSVIARYFGGIAAVSAPTTSFTAEQLIEATYRCMEAVERQGKAALKSIEVY